MKIGKPKSKRVPVRLRHKIEKASAAKQRKARKLAKKNPEWRSKVKKDPGIPNLFPYKDKILAEVVEQRRRKEEENVRRRELAKKQNSGDDAMADAMQDDSEFQQFENEEDELEDDDDDMDGKSIEAEVSNPMAALLASAKARAAEFESMNNRERDATEQDDESIISSENDVADLNKDSSRKQFDKAYKQVVDSADVVLYILDARDPTGTRSKEVEQLVMTADAGSKRLVMILNKIDLIPPPTLRSWLVHLRRSFPTLPLCASKPAPNAKTFQHKDLSMKTTSEALLRALKTFAESRQLKRAVKVGLLGYPNVGKSSVVNALSSRLGGRVTACPTGAEAGITTSLREVNLDKKLKLLDSPGIIFPNSSETSGDTGANQKARLVLLNAIPLKKIDDPIPAVALLLKRLSSSEELFAKLMEVYDLPPLHTVGDDRTTDFLVQVARKRGRLGKGGVPNLHSAAYTIINDWRDGRIQGWSNPPKHFSLSSSTTKISPASDGLVGDQKKIVREWAAEFKLDGFWGDDSNEPNASEAMEL